MFRSPELQAVARSARGIALLAAAVGAGLTGCQAVGGNPGRAASEAKAAEAAVPPVAAGPPMALAPGQEIELFDGSTLGAWKPEALGPGDAVRVADGAIQLGWGSPGTSMAWTGTHIPTSYELSLEVSKVEGVGSGYWFLTFPIDRERTCTLTLANQMAWLCGESGPAGAGATSLRFALDAREWHSVRLRVVPGRVEAEVDGETLVVQPVEAPAAALVETDAPPDLEIATWSMAAAVRGIQLERLPDGAR